MESEFIASEPVEMVDADSFDEAVLLIEQAEGEAKTEQKEPEPEAVDMQPEESARGLVRSVMGVLNFLLKFKDDRIHYDEDTILQAQNAVAPALVKHGVGSGGLTKYGEEAAAGSFLFMLGLNTRNAIIELRAADEAEAKAKKEGAENGEESQ